MRTLSIGQLEVKPNLILAPMSGVTNSCFRRLIKSENPGAIGLMVTEFVSIEGLTRGNRQSLQMITFTETERPISIQIFGHEISRMVDAAKIAEDAGADIVDINSGCPVPKVVRKGGGCELMRQPMHLAKMLRAVKSTLSIPLTLKIRSGWDNKSINAVEIARIAEDAGVSMLAVHGRSRQDLYRGSADWEIIRKVVASVKIPVVGSGDIIDSTGALQALSTGVNGIMIGRAALANPWVFSEIKSAFNAQPYQAPSVTSTVEIIRKYKELLIEELPEKAVIGKLKQFASQVTRRVPGSTNIRRALCTSSSLQQFSDVLSFWHDQLLVDSYKDNLIGRLEPVLVQGL